MLDAGITITRITEDRKLDDLNAVVPFLRVEFKVDNHGPFVEKFNKDGYSQAVRDQKLNDFAREVR